jgi:ABC-type branched-subunit amino acid transport system substrate-binding protein
VTVLATYPDDSLGALQSLRKVNVDLPVIANSSWTTGDVALIQSTLSKFKSDIFCAALWIPGSKNSVRFEKIYREKFNAFPTAEAASGFDLGVIVGQTVGRVKGDLTKESFAEAFSREACFDGTTKGQFCFPKSGGFSDKKVEFVKYSNNRFVEVK